jgi:ABC-type proline/glycine betaine transport system ATPase subunit
VNFEAGQLGAEGANAGYIHRRYGMAPTIKGARAIVISGLSGSRKSTLLKRLLFDKNPNAFGFCAADSSEIPAGQTEPTPD